MPRDHAHVDSLSRAQSQTDSRAGRTLDARRAREQDVAGAEPTLATPHAVPVPGVARTVPGRISRRGGSADDPFGGAAAAPEVVDALRRRRGSGKPLPADVAQSFGEHLGTDLSGVRVHTDGEADTISRSVGAQAFTHGTDIYFTSGSYSGGAGGQRLLAHELAHVAQNAAGRFRPAAGGTQIGRADDPAEQDADRTADRVLSALRRTAAPAPGIDDPPRVPGADTDGAIRRLPWGELGGFVEGLAAQAWWERKRKGKGHIKSALTSKVFGPRSARVATRAEEDADADTEALAADENQAVEETGPEVAAGGPDAAGKADVPNVPDVPKEPIGSVAGEIQPHVERIKTYWQLIRKIDDMPPAGTAQWDRAAAALGAEIKNKAKTAGRTAGGDALGARFAAEIAAISLPTGFRSLATKLTNEHWKCVEYLKRQDFPVHNDGSMDLPKTETGEYDFSRRTMTMLTTKEEQEPFKVSFRNGLLYRSPEYGSEAGGQDETGTKSKPATKSAPGLVDTLGGVTKAQGLGWQMFVVSRAGSWLVASQQLGVTEHASLLGGAEPAIAGEMRVRAGRVQEITNRNGASEAKRDQVMDMLVSLNSRGVDMDFPVSGYDGIEAGSNAKALLKKAGALGKVNPTETFNAIAAMDSWQPVLDEFGQERLLEVIAAQGWRTDGKDTVLDAQRATVTVRKAAEKLKVDPSVTYSAIKSLAGWSSVVSESSEVTVLKAIEAEGWHLDRGAVRNKSGTKVTPDQARRKLTSKRSSRRSSSRR